MPLCMLTLPHSLHACVTQCFSTKGMAMRSHHTCLCVPNALYGDSLRVFALGAHSLCRMRYTYVYRDACEFRLPLITP